MYLTKTYTPGHPTPSNPDKKPSVTHKKFKIFVIPDNTSHISATLSPGSFLMFRGAFNPLYSKRYVPENSPKGTAPIKNTNRIGKATHKGQSSWGADIYIVRPKKTVVFNQAQKDAQGKLAEAGRARKGTGKKTKGGKIAKLATGVSQMDISQV